MVKGMYVFDGATKYTSDDVKRLNSSIISNKTIFGDSNSLKVQAQSSPNMSVKIASGFCCSDGFYAYNSTSTNLTIASNTSGYPRKDAIVFYLDGSNTTLKVLQGTAASTPICPATSDSNYIKLAEVYVGAGVSSIQASNITDYRPNIIESVSAEIEKINNSLSGINTCIMSEHATGSHYQLVKKWSNGQMEIYQDFAMLTGVSQEWGKSYVHDLEGTTPNDFAVQFVNTPRVSVSAGWNNMGNSWFVIVKGSPTTTRGPIVQIARPSILNAVAEFHVIIHAFGRWK